MAVSIKVKVKENPSLSSFLLDSSSSSSSVSWIFLFTPYFLTCPVQMALQESAPPAGATGMRSFLAVQQSPREAKCVLASRLNVVASELSQPGC